MGRVLGLVLWRFWARREYVVVGGPRGWRGGVAEGNLVVELVAVGSEVVAVMGTVGLVHGRAVEVFHLEEKGLVNIW